MEFLKKNFLAICILISAFMLSIAIIFSALCNRFFHIERESYFRVFDKLTGATYSISSNTITKIEINGAKHIIRKEGEKQ